MNNEALIPVFVPPLATMLAHHEHEKGSPLTEEEVLSIRGSAMVIMMRRPHAEQMAQKRGYRDIDPQNCWLEWQKVRTRREPDNGSDSLRQNERR